jgi:hypothetical protein
MLPSVYGVSQHADAETHHHQTSHQLLGLHDEGERFSEGCVVRHIFRRFVHKHREFFGRNVRRRMMASQLDRMPPGRLKGHLATAEKFLEHL